MSTELTPVEGFVQVNNVAPESTTFVRSELLITRFSGGMKGLMLQLTPSDFDKGYIQLDKDGAFELIKRLQEFV